MNRCEYCLDDNCKKKKCNCSTCKLANECFKILHPTIRITNKCTQKCSHCCFESSPESNIMMSIKNADKICRFLKANEIVTINVMGGEFFCNPDWYEILEMLVDSVLHMRLVTNGDWTVIDSVRDKLGQFIEKNKDKLLMSLSFDNFHTNKHFEKAKAFLENTGCYLTIGQGKSESNGIVPVGRSSFSHGIYSMFGTYCGNPKKQYTFLIDEEGAIYKCVFGRWQYASVDDYLVGGFAKRFKEFNKKFYSIFISNCYRCNESAMRLIDSKENIRRTVVPV